MRFWRIGELARQARVTVRTLHHYDAIGLLRPSGRTSSNYRQYSETDVGRLQQIVSLRQVGLSLEEIGEYLTQPGASLLAVIERQLGALRAQAAATNALCGRLEWLAERIRSAENVPADDLLKTMETMSMIEKYYTPDQLRELEDRRLAVGEGRIKEAEAEWPRLMEEVRVEMERGTDPRDERVQALARRWQGLIEEFTGGNPRIGASLNRMYASEKEIHGMRVGPMRELGEYVRRALAGEG